MSQENYTLAQSFNKANIWDRLWYVMEASDLDVLKAAIKMQFGDKAYVIKEKSFHIMGNDNTWYDM